MVTSVNPLQPEKAELPIDVISSPNTTFLIEELLLNHEWTSLQFNATSVNPLPPLYLQLVVFQFVLLKTVEKWLCGFYWRRKQRRFNVFNIWKPQKVIECAMIRLIWLRFIFESIIWFQNVETTNKILWKCSSNDNKLAFFSQENLISRENTLLFERKIVFLQSEIFVIIPTKIKPISICKTL